MAGKTWIGWVVALAVVVSIGPLLLGRGDPLLQGAHDEIARMSEVERAVLQRKYDQYRALTEVERNALRDMHRQLEADRNQKALHVAVLQDYSLWVKTVDAWEQDELAHQSDAQLKVKRVSEIVQKHKAEAVANTADDEEHQRPGEPWMPPLLTREELTKVFDTWAKRLTNLTEDEQKEIDNRTGLKRFGVQIRHLKKTVAKSDAMLLSISESEFKEMALATGNKELIERVAAIPEPGMKRWFASRCIVASCIAQYHREGAAMSDSELEQHFHTLSPEQQDALLQEGASDFKTLLRLQRLELDPDIQELVNLMPKFSAAEQRWQRIRPSGPFLRPSEGGGGPFGNPRDRGGEPRFDPQRDGDRPGRPGPRGPNGERPFRPGEPPPREGEFRGPPPAEEESR